MQIIALKHVHVLHNRIGKFHASNRTVVPNQRLFVFFSILSFFRLIISFALLYSLNAAPGLQRFKVLWERMPCI